MDVANTLFLIIAAFTGLSAVAVLVTQNIVRSAVWLLFTLAGTAGVFFLLGADFVAATQLIIYVGGILVLVVFGVMLTAQGPFITMKVGAAEWVIAAVVGLLLLGVISITSLTAVWPDLPAEQMTNAADSMSSAQLGMAFSGIKEVVPEHNVTGLNTMQIVTISRSPTGGHYALTFPGNGIIPTQTTGNIAYNANAAAVQQALRLLAGLESVVVAQTGNSPNFTHTIIFQRVIGPIGKLTFTNNLTGANPELTVASGDIPRKPVAYLLPFEIVSVHLLVVLIGAAYLARAKRRRGAVS
jgi:NADH-quinone oxidoreductase subunit J